jgi:tetratricopeptide (TPR) repeat protein
VAAAPSVRRPVTPPAHVATADDVVRLQRSAGNSAVTTWLQRDDDGADTATAPATGPAGASQLMTKGIALLRAEKYDDAADAFRSAYDLYPSHRILMNLGTALYEGKRYAEAIEIYRMYLKRPESERKSEIRDMVAKARKLVPAQMRADFDAAQEAYLAGRYEEAFKLFGRARLAQAKPEFRYDEAAALQKMGRLETAAEYYELYLQEAPRAADAAKVRGLIDQVRTAPIPLSGEEAGSEYMKRGLRLLRGKQYPLAIAAFDEGWRAFPSHRFLLNKAAALRDSGRHLEALLAYQAYLADPGVAGGDDSRTDEVRKIVRELEQRTGGREPLYSDVDASRKWFEKAAAAYQSGDFVTALDGFDQAYRLNPTADFRYNQAACLDRLGRKLMAASRYEQYLSELPGASDAGKVRKRITKLRAEAMDHAHGAFDRAREAYANGKYKEAANLFLEAFEETGLPEVLYNRAAALDMGGEKLEAVKTYALYLELVPKAADEQKVRKRIRKLQEETGTELMAP